MNYFVLFILVTSTYFGLNEACKKNQVEIHNQLGPGKVLQFHCRSGDDDIGVKTLNFNDVPYIIRFHDEIPNLTNFDVRSEQFNMIQVPKELSGLIRDNPIGFIEYGGKPAIFDQTYLIQMGKVDLWVLEDGGAWSTKSLVLQPCQMHLLNESIKLLVRGTTQTDEVILAPCKLFSNYYLLYYDLRKNDLRKFNVGLTSDHWFGKPYADYILFDKNESILHLET
ncbi:hypothetical protein HID58_095565 [Brassica napus]|uniref:BnaAnng21850D protein n=2 Tax=Brassica napus TaxID=3708 RepID=A0A078JHS2_BRANA|nr:hypothetical protein HID58_092097 [Brassica napus]KAH0850408.1 hypothetical protein HID58_095565 [Brassica napus]CAF1921556.1 unnamed protein product [Brassica napus]CDY66229.1 BnaAnng21850D [Brassica napus]